MRNLIVTLGIQLSAASFVACEDSTDTDGNGDKPNCVMLSQELDNTCDGSYDESTTFTYDAQ